MTKHLGRNPFGKKKSQAPTVPQKGKPTNRIKISSMEKNSKLEWLFIEVPAKSYLFALKAALLLKGALDKK